MTVRRKLIEVALPLEAINRESAREKSIRHGHPSTLHLWWARRPLAACRAVLFAQLVDDPSSRPDLYPTEAEQEVKRKELFSLLERLVVWENSNDPSLLAQARAEIIASCDGELPAILDPFAGGGSIPLEAQRLGLDARASDLNPVAVLINKALIEIPPKWANRPPVFPAAAGARNGWDGAAGLAEDVRRYGEWMRDEAKKRIGHLYPKVELPDGKQADVIAWIWARTVKCPNPACGILMPLVRSWWLGKKKGKEAFVIPHVADRGVTFSIGSGAAGAPRKDDDGTVTRNGAVCVGCRTGTPLAYVRAEGKAGRIGAQLVAVVAQGRGRRVYVAPTSEHEAAADVPKPEDVPDTELPEAALGFRIQGYGMTRHVDLFTPRQLTALATFSDLVEEARQRTFDDAIASGMPAGEGLEAEGSGARAYADSVAVYLACVLSKVADIGNALVSWKPSMDQAIHLFTRQTIPMLWDYAETPILSDHHAGGYMVALRNVIKAIPSSGSIPGCVEQRDAASRDYCGVVVATDPPYYDNVGYADLSDFFYVWLRRSLAPTFPKLLATVLTPKTDELVADPFRRGGDQQAQRYFEASFVDVFQRIRASADERWPITVFYAFKQSETSNEGSVSTGWQTLLDGMVRTGWQVTGTWPIRTELANRVRGQGANALASSVVLALRPRHDAAEAVTRRGFLAALKAELPSALKDLQQGSVAPVDLAQAAIGPGMAVFSRYSRVLETDGSDMKVRTALALINHSIDEAQTEQEGDFDAETRFCVRWFTQHAWNDGNSGEADDLARAMNTSVEGLCRGGVFFARAGVARLISPESLPEQYDPLTDDRVSVWEIVLHLARTLDSDGIPAAARLMERAGGRVDLDVAKELAYRLYTICERSGWASTGLLFNGLGTAWNDVAAAARGTASTAAGQTTMSFDDEL